jgi:transcription initiation factor TFIIIB Brf1 subunit/transcription initiation factor TFIIB
MTEFILFNQALEEYQKMKISDKENASENGEYEEETDEREVDCNVESHEPPVDSCSHENVISEKGVNVCVDCGEEIFHRIAHDKEWRYYGPSDSKHSSDPNRVQVRKTEERSIFKDVENLGFSESIVSKANKIYAQVTKNKIFRGDHRKAIVFACVYHAYKMVKKPQSHEHLIQVFNLNKKKGLRGLKYVNLYAPKDSKIRTTYISPETLTADIMKKFNATTEQKQEVTNLYDKIKNKSSRLNRSRPQSVACGLVFYWIQIKHKDISLKDFAKKVNLSELTINRIAKEISTVLETIEE